MSPNFGDFPEFPEKAVNCATTETNSTAESLLGAPLHCIGVLRILLGTTIQAFPLLPVSIYFPSCSHGEAPFKERAV
jgi:hypothetical protein